ncbi:MAG: 30S ribosomal protein S4 [Candidatus Woesearchaeota archaeon]|nr:30S ribosomal protein S4 [Candidatus Woesearchaeota archaeon]
MGDPKKIRAKYSGPSHPWQRKRIEDEKKILGSFGLKNKKEIWKMQSRLRSFKAQAKSLISRTDAQSKKEEAALLAKLYNIGIIEQGANMDAILELTLADMLKRRLQSMVCNQKLAQSMRQARQFIVHGHVTVNGILIDIPSYLVKRIEEPAIKFHETSTLKDPEHPERIKKRKERPPKEKRERRDPRRGGRRR